MANKLTAADLRVGNYVYDNLGGILRIKGVNVDSDLSHIKPIPLTEEWLIKFGFERNENGLFKLFNQSEVPILLNGDLNGWTCDGINFSINNTQYVHQLQNLYYALTNTELTFKEDIQ